VAEQARRIDQILSSYGYCSRSEARTWVRQRRITVDGQPVLAADKKYAVSRVRIDGEAIDSPNGLLVLLHKPAGYVCSRDSNEGQTVYQLLPKRWSRRNPPITTIGRLDRDTTGVLLLTDLGELVQRWTSPRHKVPKLYEVRVDAPLKAELIPIFQSGKFHLADEDKPCLPAVLKIIDPYHATLELNEGRYHQVKRMFAHHGYQVLQLHRTRFGDFDVDGLNPSQWKVLPLPGDAAS
jgi:16S rRNA pseudouridine516 synthase